MGFPYLASRVLATTWAQIACLLEDLFNLEVLELKHQLLVEVPLGARHRLRHSR